jgi:phage host-nuclease inhibitor protein Gam
MTPSVFLCVISPSEEKVRLCIRALGDWTRELKALADKMADKGEVSLDDTMIHDKCIHIRVLAHEISIMTVIPQYAYA